jgi:2-iminoacetate synthase
MNETDAWARRIVPKQIDRYLTGGGDFIDDDHLHAVLQAARPPSWTRLEEILAKSLAVETLSPEETAELISVTDPAMRARMRETGAAVKKKVYDNRIVTFAPLYLSNHCVNDCSYCGLRRSNTALTRRTLSLDDVKRETAVLAGKIGHKRLIAVYGEHPAFDVHYMVDTLRAIYETKTASSTRTRRWPTRSPARSTGRCPSACPTTNSGPPPTSGC